VLQALPESDFLADDGANASPLIQNPLDQTDMFSSNDENDIDEETMYVTLSSLKKVLLAGRVGGGGEGYADSPLTNLISNSS